jgi:hypothetical protein
MAQKADLQECNTQEAQRDAQPEKAKLDVEQAQKTPSVQRETQDEVKEEPLYTKRGPPSLVLRTIATTVAKFFKRPSKSMTAKWSGIVKASKMAPSELLEACSVGLNGLNFKLEDSADMQESRKFEPYPFQKGVDIDRERLLILIRIARNPKDEAKHSLALRFCQL